MRAVALLRNHSTEFLHMPMWAQGLSAAEGDDEQRDCPEMEIGISGVLTKKGEMSWIDQFFALETNFDC